MANITEGNGRKKIKDDDYMISRNESNQEAIEETNKERLEGKERIRQTKRISGKNIRGTRDQGTRK